MADTISAYIITLNEESNIATAIESVGWMDEIIVLDSGSTDKTVAVAQKLGARVHSAEFEGFASQKNRALDLCTSDWCLNIDADEEVSPALTETLKSLLASPSAYDCYEMTRRTQYMGTWLNHCGWYPEYRTRLSRRGTARWTGGRLHERLICESSPGRLDGDLLHRPYRDLADHFGTIAGYAETWADIQYENGSAVSALDLLSRPVARFLKMYVLKAGYRDGMPGLVASGMGAVYTFMKYACLYEKLRDGK